MEVHGAGFGFLDAQELLADVVLEQYDLVVVDGLSVGSFFLEEPPIVVAVLAVDHEASVNRFDVGGNAQAKCAWVEPFADETEGLTPGRYLQSDEITDSDELVLHYLIKDWR